MNKPLDKNEYLKELLNAKFELVYSDPNDIFTVSDNGQYELDLFVKNIGGIPFAIRCVGYTKAECIENLMWKIQEYIPSNSDFLYETYLNCFKED